MENVEDIEQYRRYLTNLTSEENRSAALNDIKNFVVHKSANEVSPTLRDGGISKIVLCLDLQDKNHVDLACDVLKACFEKFEVGEVIKNYTSHIMYCLRHEKSCVRKLAVNEVYKMVRSSENAMPVDQYIDVFVATAQLVADEDVGVANTAILITSHLPHEAYPKVLEEMKIALDYTSSSKCNALEVVVNISSESADLFAQCVEEGYIDFMISELKSEDVLYQLNILELLSRLAIKPYGINYLLKNGALNQFTLYVTDLKNNPSGALVLPGYMKFFGAIAHHYPREIIENYTPILDCMFEAIQNGDESILPVALDTLGFIGSTNEGKLCLTAVGAKFTQAIEKVGQLIMNSPTEIKTRALNCLASLINVSEGQDSSNPTDHRITLMTREWFRSLSSQPPAMDVLLQICKNPFIDIKLAGFNLLAAVCQHLWGEALVAKTAGFIEYLLDRSVEQTKESRDAKYDLIRKLSTSTAFSSEDIARLQTYVEQGPYFSETKLAVAVEEGD